MSCEQIRFSIMKYLDGEMHDLEAAQFKQHLKSCIKCRNEFACYEDIFACLEDAPVIEVPENFVAGVMSRVREYEMSKKARCRHLAIIVYGLAVIGLLFGIVWLISNINEISILKLIGTFSEMDATAFMIGFWDVLRGFYTAAVSLLMLTVTAVGYFIDSYFHIFILSMTLFMILQRLVVVYLVNSGRRG